MGGHNRFSVSLIDNAFNTVILLPAFPKLGGKTGIGIRVAEDGYAD
jgi:hypothetical protein